MRIFVTFLLAISCFQAVGYSVQRLEEECSSDSVSIPDCIDAYKTKCKYELIEAIIYVESRWDTNAWNKKEKAAGVLQIRPIMLKEVNRILGHNKYTLDDRWDINKSIDMFIVYQDYWNPEWDYEKAARMWNGGKPEFNDSTLDYWHRVKKQLR